MAKKKKSKFGSKVGSNVKTQKTAGASYGYLNLPSGVSVYKEPPGKTVELDIIPYLVSNSEHLDKEEDSDIAVVGEEWYKVPFYIHRDVGAESETVVCPKTFGKKCPICEHKAKRVKEGAEKDELDTYKQSKRNLYCVIPRKDKSNKDSIDEMHIWDISQWMFQKMLNDELEEDEKYYDFPDLECGYSLKIRFSEEVWQKNKFAKTSRIDFVKRKEQIGSEFIDKVPKMDEILEVHSYDKIQNMFFEIDEEEEKTSKKKKGKKSKEVAEEEPKRKKKSAKAEEEPKKMKRKGKQKCPNGHKFGKDVDIDDDCGKCKLYDACANRYDELNEDLPF